MLHPAGYPRPADMLDGTAFNKRTAPMHELTEEGREVRVVQQPHDLLAGVGQDWLHASLLQVHNPVL